MNVFKKLTVRWIKDGKCVPSGTPTSERLTIESKRFYGTLTLFNGKRKQVPLCEDQKASETLLRRLQTEEDHQRANGVNRYGRERQRPLSEHVGDYETYLRSKNNSAHYVRITLVRLRSLLTETKTKFLEELDAGRVSATLAKYRARSTKPISIATSNHYARCIKGFSRWLWIERRTPDDPLTPLRLLNAKVDRRHLRRAFTMQELQKLIQATRDSGKRLRWLPSKDRAILYAMAAFTGLRASELASLTPQSIDLNARTVSVQASYSKRRRNDTLPLHASLVELLTPWLPTKTGRLFPGTWANERGANTTKMFRYDLRKAGIPYLDSQGRYSDFHALRHTFITSMARSGIHPAKAKELARHSTITLTMDVYLHVETEELRQALDSLPSL